ncbi:hypothetical protein EVAR_70199_1 [Eumeta japonica]|uniref:Uncharacterized protein n=1 Tax=Eumeta variegata TaxID=151549 RepID=A0A4C1ZR64_EUMVA|nr:hypothetical protein EVAR_70199_1 [Eumeta japonica]
MVALQRTILKVKKDKDRLVNIFSSSRSSLEILSGSKTYHLLAHKARHYISKTVKEGRAVCLFWVIAHARMEGNERTDEIARRTVLKKKTATDYDNLLLSYAKNVIRKAGLK